MAMIWKRFRKVPEEHSEDLYGDLGERLEARSLDRMSGCLDLFFERRHPLVRAAMTASRRRRHVVAAALAGTAILIFVVVVMLALAGSPSVASWVGVVFACLWPLVAFIGASVDAGAAVVSEREGNTALQLVLTPLAKRPIAASKVLPAAFPYVVGMLGALPLYLMIGSAHPFMFEYATPNPLVFWPLRFFAPILGCGMEGISVAGVLVGLLMWFTDVVTVWAAAHWGAAYGVRLGRMPLIALATAWRLGLTLLSMTFVLLLTFLLGLAVALSIGLVLAFFSSWLPVVPVVAAGLWAFVVLWRRYFLTGPVETVMAEFSHFDELARDDYRPRPLRGWSVLMPYGDRT